LGLANLLHGEVSDGEADQDSNHDEVPDGKGIPNDWRSAVPCGIVEVLASAGTFNLGTEWGIFHKPTP
jgi:hypothetical protein